MNLKKRPELLGFYQILLHWELSGDEKSQERKVEINIENQT